MTVEVRTFGWFSTANVSYNIKKSQTSFTFSVSRENSILAYEKYWRYVCHDEEFGISDCLQLHVLCK